jgi:hypothetical protein
MQNPRTPDTPSMHSNPLKSLGAILPLCLVLSQCNSYTTYSPPAEHTALTDKTASMLGLHYFLPRSKITIKGEYVKVENQEGQDELNFVVSTSVMNYADTTAPQFARISVNGFYHEDSTLEVKSGLLNSAIARPEDRTPEIIYALAQTALNLAQIPSGVSPFFFDMRSIQPPLAAKTPFEPFNVSFDPFIKQQREDAERALSRKGWTLSFTNEQDFPLGSGPKAKPGRSRLGNQPEEPRDVTVPGLAYRRPYPVIQNLNPMDGWDVKPGATRATYPERTDMMLPDPSTLAYVPVKRGFMTKRETEVTFTNGEPTKLILQAPSPVLGVVTVPVKVTKMVLDAVPAIIKVQSSN